MLVCWNLFPIANKKHLRLYESNNIIINIYIYRKYVLRVMFLAPSKVCGCNGYIS